VIAAVFLWAVPVTVGVVGLVDGLPDPSLILSAPGTSVVDPALEAARAASDPRLALLFVVLGPTIGTYWLNLYALQRVPPSTVALFIYLQPVISALSAGRVLGEAPGGRTWVAGLLSGAGVWLASRPARAAPVPARPTQPGGGTG
jgi:drug/metabolite transporter (DMT)-like permease